MTPFAPTAASAQKLRSELRRRNCAQRFQPCRRSLSRSLYRLLSSSLPYDIIISKRWISSKRFTSFNTISAFRNRKPRIERRFIARFAVYYKPPACISARYSKCIRPKSHGRWNAGVSLVTGFHEKKWGFTVKSPHLKQFARMLAPDSGLKSGKNLRTNSVGTL